MGKGWTFLLQLHSIAGPVLQLLYPLYASVMAMSTSKLDDEQWPAYWIIYSFLTLLEMVVQPALEWLPIWYEVKLVFVAWLVLPQFKGAAFLYEKYVREQILKRRGGSHDSSSKAPTGKAKNKFVQFMTPKNIAMQEAKLANPNLPPSAQLVGNAFVEQYYQVLHHSPELVYKFYQDTSALSRTDINGNMTTVKTMDAIRIKIKSLNYEEYTAEIKTADAQESFEKGVIVLVTGCLTGKDNVGRKFTQTFFLAPQENGYFVLNDVFRYIEDHESSQTNSVLVNTIEESAPVTALIAEPEPTQAPEHLVVEEPATSLDEDPNNGPEVCDPSDDEEGSIIEEEAVIEEPPIQSSQSRDLPEVDPIPETQEDAPKKSYASNPSIVKVMKSSVTSSPVWVARVRTVSANTNHPSVGSAKPSPVPEASAPSGDAAPESSNAHEEAEGHSIYVRNLPYDATVEQLEKEFKKFGSIKRGGIQVRSSKQGLSFGFVEFESVNAMQSALEASPIMIGDRQAMIEEKRTTTRGQRTMKINNGGRGRFSSARAGFRSGSFRGGRGNYGSRSFGRNEFRNQGEFTRSKSPAGRNGEGYQRVNPNGRGGGRQGAASNHSSVPT